MINNSQKYTIGQTMEFVRKEIRGWTLPNVAAKLDGTVDYQVIRHIENGTTKKPHFEVITTLMQLYRVNLYQVNSYMISGQWPNRNELDKILISCPLLTVEQLSSNRTIDDIIKSNNTDYLTMPDHMPPTLTFAFTVIGDSMISANGPYSFCPGSVVFAEQSSIATIGDFVIARNIKNYRTTFKKYSSDGADEYLVSLNLTYPAIPIADYEIIGVVRESNTRIN